MWMRSYRAPPPYEAVGMSSHKLLFIDDDPEVLRSLGNYFERTGNVVFRASSGKEGIQIWERERPAVTVCDLDMPGVDGQGVLKALAPRKAVVIMLTGHGNIEAAVAAMRLGAENFLTKPVEMRHLAQVVEKAAEKEALRTETVALRARLTPTPKRRLFRAAALAAIVFVALVLGTAIGKLGEDDAPLSSPIPMDSTLG